MLNIVKGYFTVITKPSQKLTPYPCRVTRKRHSWITYRAKLLPPASYKNAGTNEMLERLRTASHFKLASFMYN